MAKRSDGTTYHAALVTGGGKAVLLTVERFTWGDKKRTTAKWGTSKPSTWKTQAGAQRAVDDLKKAYGFSDQDVAVYWKRSKA